MAGKRSVYPRHIRTTNRAWKAKKRRELRAVLKAMDVYRMGCAYTPECAYVAFDDATAAIREVQARISEAEWGR